MPADPKPGPKLKPLPVPEAVFWKPPSYCRECNAEIWFWKNPKTDKWVPVNADSTSHFQTCTNPKRFSKKGAG